MQTAKMGTQPDEKEGPAKKGKIGKLPPALRKAALRKMKAAALAKLKRK